MRIVVLDAATIDLAEGDWASISELGELATYASTDHCNEAQIQERCDGADIVLSNKVPLTAGTLSHCSSLKLISVLATGYNNIDLDAARAHKITVCNVAGYSTESTAQHTIALILELANQVGHHAKLVAEGGWVRSKQFCFWDSPLSSLDGKTLGIVGFGSIGRKVGEIAHALGMSILASMRAPRNPPEYEPFEFAGNQRIFRESDIVTLHCPQTPENIGFVNRDLLGTMKPSAWLINCSRGPLINEADLRIALDNQTIAAAAIDVVTKEPMLADNPLIGASNLLITPHIAWAAKESRQKLLQRSAENIRSFLDDHPINVVS